MCRGMLNVLWHDTILWRDREFELPCCQDWVTAGDSCRELSLPPFRVFPGLRPSLSLIVHCRSTEGWHFTGRGDNLSNIPAGQQLAYKDPRRDWFVDYRSTAAYPSAVLRTQFAFGEFDPGAGLGEEDETFTQYNQVPL